MGTSVWRHKWLLITWILSFCLVVILLYAISATAPSPMATHFNLRGEANATAPKSGFLWFMSCFLLGLNLFYWAGRRFLRIPGVSRMHASGSISPGSINPIIFITAIFTNLISALAMYWVLQENQPVPFASEMPFAIWLLLVLLFTSVYLIWIFLLSRKMPQS